MGEQLRKQGRLAAVVSGARPPGVYRWRSRAHGAAVRRELARLGWATYLLDGRRIRGHTALLDRCAETLRLPAWSRRSTDALAVCLRDLSWLPGRGHVLLWPAWAVLAGEDPPAWKLAYDVFAAAAAGRPAEVPPLYLLLRGPGPAGGPGDEIPTL